MSASDTEDLIDGESLEALASRVRRRILDLTYSTKSPHLGSCFSCVEILIALYFRILRHTPQDRHDPNRDRFFLSKGHACLSLYVVLAERGFLAEDVLARYGIVGGSLEHHAKRNLEYGIESSSGSLGHGLGLAVGAAKSAKLSGASYRAFALLSDGELNEGSTWEAALFGAHHNLSNLIAIVDYNKIQALGRTSEVLNLDPLAAKWAAFGWEVREVPGHEFEALINSLETPPAQHKPLVVIAHTLKGKGVSFMEDKLLWHYRCPDPSELELARQELGSVA